MHSTTTLKTTDFCIRICSQDDQQIWSEARIEDVFEGFHPQDRLGIIIHEEGEGLGASALIMATATRFYDFYRSRLGKDTNQLFIYPEIFTFHVGKKTMLYTQLDIFPIHKEVEVECDPQRILEVVNDRGITRLLVPDGTPITQHFSREEVCSAKERIITALVYSPSGRVNQPNITIQSCEEVEKYVLQCMSFRKELSELRRELLISNRSKLIIDGRPTETYKRIDINTALNMLVSS